jgi:hypothetical protein
VRYHRNATNIGGANNENLTFRMARGEYFRLAAHDDLCAPTLLERCVAELDRRPEAVLCHTGIVEIDENGDRIGERVAREGTAARPHQRFRELSYRWYACEATYGLIRSEILRKTRLQQNYTGSDRVLLVELGLHGPFALVDEPLFFKRYHEGNRYKDWRGRMAWFMPSLAETGKATFPNWLQLFDYFETLRRVPLPWDERLLCHVWIGRWLAYHSKGLAWDLATAGLMKLQPAAARRARYAETERWL